MARPEASAAAEAFYEALGPAFSTYDEANDWAALKMCMGLTAGTLEKLYEYVTDDDDRPGWQIVLDPDAAPADVLPWLAQFDGAVFRPEMTEQQQRDAIKSPEAFRRGSIEAMEAFLKRNLTGSKAVVITERYTANAWRLLVETDEAETPDPARLEAEFRTEQKPIGILLFFNSRPVWTWLEMREEAEWNTWLKVREEAPTWLAARTHEP